MYIYYVNAPISGWHEVNKGNFESYRNHLINNASGIKEDERKKYAAKKCLAVPKGLAREISILVDAGFFASVPAFLALYKADPLRMYVKLEQIGAGKYEEPCKKIRDYLLY